MLNNKYQVLIALTVLLSFLGCNDKKIATDSSQKLIELNKKYPQIPKIEQIRNFKNGLVYEELKQRYASNLQALNKQASALGARLVVIILTPEETTKASLDFIKGQCSDNKIDVYDLTENLKVYKPNEITQIPFDTHWSKKGAQIISDLLIPVLTKYENVKSNIKYTDNERPETFGDLEVSQNAILDGGKDLPYNLITNKQGLRMDHDVEFPKTKQTFLLLGDSQIYFPFLDNKDISSNLLQQKFPEKEILNAGVIGYSMDDYVSLLKEKAKYAEPDVILLFTNTNDITDMFFTQRNKVGRNRQGISPSKNEEDFYKSVLQNN